VNIEAIVEDLAAKIDFESRGTCLKSQNDHAVITFEDRMASQPSPQLIAQLVSIGADYVATIEGECCNKLDCDNELIGPSAAKVCLRYTPANAISTVGFDATRSESSGESQVKLASALQKHVGFYVSLEFLSQCKTLQKQKFISLMGSWIATSAGLHSVAGLYSVAGLRAIIVHDALGQADESNYR
jgi:hypothetical protein